MRIHKLFTLPCLIIWPAFYLSAGPVNQAVLKQQVIATERAFARSMADRNHVSFSSFISTEAIFLSTDKPLYGKQEITNAWKRFFESPAAPFSWEPAIVEVLESGNLAISTGPVRDSKGKILGTYTSIWRREESESWRIVFDKSDPICQ